MQIGVRAGLVVLLFQVRVGLWRLGSCTLNQEWGEREAIRALPESECLALHFCQRRTLDQCASVACTRLFEEQAESQSQDAHDDLPWIPRLLSQSPFRTGHSRR